MKRLSLFIFMVLSVITGTIAQNVDDALRYSQIFYGGTARSTGMGGAFTALGGDISCLSQNPAGLGVFRSSELTVTPQLFQIKTTAGYNGVSTTGNLSNFNLGQIGIVANLVANNKETGLITLNLGYSFNKTDNLSQSIVIQGVSNTSSMADYWAALGNKGGGTFYQNLQGPEGIAFDTWIMDTITGSGGKSYGTVFSNYGDSPASTYGQTEKRLVTNEGYIGEHAFSIGSNYSNKLFLGATFGITVVRYTSDYEQLESTDITLPSQFQSFTYTDHYEDKGTGYTIKLGAIYKPVDAVRIGLAFHSPTWYKINEYYYNDITSHFTDGAQYESSNTPSRYSYALATPFHVLTGVAVQIKKFALLSADYEYVDYSTARFSETGDGYDFSAKNLEIKNNLKSTNNIRFGAEFRLSNVYLRTGYGFYGKPFKSGQDNANLEYNTLSFGAGIREQNISIDFAYTNYKYSQNYFLYPVNAGVDPAVANLNTMKNMFTLTLGYKFGI
jgi:Outer membrane protein transport protein (OMPP1/FadL/TodX)